MYLVALLASPVWQKRKRTSLSVCENAYFADMAGGFRALLMCGYKPGFN
jgi:hypothetical protein